MKMKSVRISSELLSYIDAAMEQMKNELGERLFRYRSEVVSTAVKEFIKSHKVKLDEPQIPPKEDETDCMTGCS
jgi:metal-responsive CopG/Arc/MetJ family transcriptional regulator